MRVAGLNTVTNRRAEGYEQMRPRSGQRGRSADADFPTAVNEYGNRDTFHCKYLR